MGVGMLAVLLPSLGKRHKSLPSLAETPMVPPEVSWTYCLTPVALEMTIDEYWAESPRAERQISSPVSLSRATMDAFGPPGVQTRRSPSMRGDSV